ncbi:AraC family transcriptional regulator [Lentibacter sp. XHP0401]|jgi:AraC-like DNA-binding protein|uniref:AraC family transcriptional regulator n=1 Tax=Lentibacter sp. XHP0401 TaxID=2984334 RepID=UPI0021E98590|nr:AraC family transcriptional regulator [Lentibacter sp. XHP0401]MCV2892769.1 AraC family transcriptional regulator [Lentibacter sp. XHP0401]
MDAAIPLSDHELFSSCDLDEARERVAQIYCPHRLETMGDETFLARHNHVRGHKISINYMEYGARTRIVPGELERFFLLQIPLLGTAQIRNGNSCHDSDIRRASILNPHRPTDMCWSKNTKQLLLQIDRGALNRQLSTLLGEPAGQVLSFEGHLDLTTSSGFALKSLLNFLVREIDIGRMELGHGLMSRHIEQTLMVGLIEAAPNNFSAALGSQRGSASPSILRRAEEFIDANLKSDLCLDQISAAAGTTPRNLQLVFKKFRGISPMQFWRCRRLEGAYNDLKLRNGNVTEVAMRWGFSHLGRFSSVYRNQFGETPLETRQRWH